MFWVNMTLWCLCWINMELPLISICYMQNGDGDLQQSTSQSAHYHSVEGRGPRMDMQVPEPSSSSSFSSLPVPRPPVQANGPLRPPHPAPSSQLFNQISRVGIFLLPLIRQVSFCQ